MFALVHWLPFVVVADCVFVFGHEMIIKTLKHTNVTTNLAGASE